jgi:hypothetical protein
VPIATLENVVQVLTVQETYQPRRRGGAVRRGALRAALSATAACWGPG